MDHIGIDVHKRQSQVCILTEEGELIERRIVTTPAAFAALLGERPPAKILLEASTESEWVARCLKQLGHAVIVGDPNFAPMYATRTRRVKTDRRDAHALTDACVLGAYRLAHRVSDAKRHVRASLAVRDALVRTGTRYIALIRALLRQHGWRLRSGKAEHIARRVLELPCPGTSAPKSPPSWPSSATSTPSSRIPMARSPTPPRAMRASSACRRCVHRPHHRGRFGRRRR